MKTSIYVCYHNKCNMLEDDIFKYIYCGAAINGEENYIPGTLRDDTGDNISYKNRELCEITAMYWAWKNDKDSDYIGFMHYRRHLNLSENQNFQEDRYGVIYREYINDEYITDFSLFHSGLQKYIPVYDVILPKAYDVRNLGVNTNFDQFKESDDHHIEDYINACDIIKREYPSLENFINEFNASNKCYFTNIFVMRRDLFLNYASFLFDIIFKLETILDFSLYNPQEARSIAFMSERIFNIYLNRLLCDTKIKSVELQRTYVSNTFIETNIEPDDSIPIILAFDNNFIKFAASCVMSIYKHAHPANKYTIYILHSNITNESVSKFKENFNSKNFIIKFIDCSYIFDKINLHIHMHLTKETFFRLAIPNLFKNFKKVIYLDADTITCTDIAELYNIDINGYAIGGVKDYIMNGFYIQNCTSNIETGCLPCREYFDNYLNISISEYIQAGVLLINIEEILRYNIDKKFFQLINNTYWYMDQDLINIACAGRKKIIDMHWNVANGDNCLDVFYKKIYYKEFYNHQSCIIEPHIIHYAGPKKPWLDPSLPLAYKFWEYCRKTNFYENVIEDCITSKTFCCYNKCLLKDFTPKNYIKSLINKALPVGTRRRNIAKLMYNLIHKATNFRRIT